MLFGVRVALGAPPGSRLATLPWRNILTVSLVSIGILYFMWLVRDLLIPFVIAFFLASLLDPVVTRMQRKGSKRAHVVTLLFLGSFVGLLGLIVLVGPRAQGQLTELSEKAPGYVQQVSSMAETWYESHSKQLAVIGLTENPFSSRSGPFENATRTALDSVKQSLAAIAGKILWIIIIPISLFYFLLEYQAFRARLISLVPEHQRLSVDLVSSEVVDIFSAYVRGLAKVCFIYGCVAALLFGALGVPYAIFLGIAAGFLYAVPYVGPALAVIGAGIISMSASGATVPHTAVVVGAFIAMHLTFDYGVTPRMVGGSVGIHPVLNIFALMCGATLFGVWGMLLAVPVAASVQMISYYFFPRLAAPPPYDPFRAEPVMEGDPPAVNPEAQAAPAPIEI
jgi:predicted PurR-regulated permease PerM